MSTKHFNYFDDYKSLILECSRCHWKGTFEQGSVECYADLMDCTCPECHVFVSPMLAIVLFPTLEELRANADRPGVREWVQGIDGFFDRFESQKLRGPEQLPEINDDSFSLIWDHEPSQGKDDARTLIKHKDVLIFSEPACFHCGRFGEIAELLKAKYGDRVKDLVPTKKSESALYGEAGEGEAQVDWFRVQVLGANVSKPIREPQSDSLFRKPTFAEVIAHEEGPPKPEPALEADPAKSDGHSSPPIPTPRKHGTVRPVPGVPGTYWERTETGTTLVSVPDPDWDKLSPEEQRSITQRMWKCLGLAQHLDRVTALRDEFTKIAGEETRSSGTKLTERKPVRETDGKMDEQEDDLLIGDFNLDEKYRERIRNSNIPEALADLKAAGIDSKGQQPIVHILGGGAFTGKTKVELIRSLAELPDAVVISTDIFMEGIPEYQLMKKSDPLGAARRAHGEACDMAKEATTRAVQYRLNLILDKVSGDPVRLRADMEAFRRAGYWVELRFVDRPLEVALPGMVTRFEKTGQWVAPDVVTRGHVGAAAAFHENKDFADRATLRIAPAGERHQLVYSRGRNREGMR
jgi:hypothetical protein